MSVTRRQYPFQLIEPKWQGHWERQQTFRAWNPGETIATFKRQIKSLGFSYDWTREIDTTDPRYFKWTQWIFLKMYNAWFNPQTNKAEPIDTLPSPPELQGLAAPEDGRTPASQQTG